MVLRAEVWTKWRVFIDRAQLLLLYGLEQCLVGFWHLQLYGWLAIDVNISEDQHLEQTTE